jgi:hypothetical protein
MSVLLEFHRDSRSGSVGQATLVPPMPCLLTSSGKEANPGRTLYMNLTGVKLADARRLAQFVSDGTENTALDAHLLDFANGNNHPPLNRVAARRPVVTESPEEDTDNE